MKNEAVPLISVKGVSYSYGYESVLDDVSLDIHDTDYLAIIGPNGGGKTTLLKIILGLISPVQGGVVWRDGKAAAQIGYVPQFANFERQFPLSVSEVVLMGRLGSKPWWKKTSDSDRDITADILKTLALDSLADKPVGELSGGQLQRVLIARALVCEPGILFLDEPVASIDSSSRFTLSSLLTELNKNIPIVVVTHDITSFASNVLHIACVNRTLFYHGERELASGCLDEAYGCPVELVAHGVPHRVLQDHTAPVAGACSHHGSK